MRLQSQNVAKERGNIFRRDTTIGKAELWEGVSTAQTEMIIYTFIAFIVPVLRAFC